MDPVTLLQSAEIPATRCRFEQNYVSCICFAPCENLFFLLFSPNGALALDKGFGEQRAAVDLRGQGMEMTAGSLSFPGCQLKSVFSWQQTEASI